MGGPTGRSETDHGTIGEVWDSSGDPGEVRDGSEDPRGGPGRVGGPSRRSGTGWGTLREFRNGSLDSRGSLGRVGGPWGGSGRVGDPRGGPGRFVGPSDTSETGRRTLEDVLDGSMDSRGGPGCLARTLGKSGTVRWTIG